MCGARLSPSVSAMTTTRIRRLIASAAPDRHVELERGARARRRRNRYAALVFAGALLAVAPAGASAKVFLELPGVPGESTVAGFENQIELDSFQLGLTNRVQMGTEKVTGKPSFSGVVVSKRLDRSSPTLMLRTANMAAFPFARVRVTRSSATGE